MTIKHILVPTDFSVTARSAYRYAQKLAQVCDALITVVHINQYFLPISEIAVAPQSLQTDDLLAESMRNFVEERQQVGNVATMTSVKTKILRGDPVTQLVELSKTGQYDLIVMGTTGLQDLLTKIIGSTSMEVSNKAHCPVLLVPREAKWHGVENIMFATSQAAITRNVIKKITDLTRDLNANVDFVHVDNTPEDIDSDAERVLDLILEESEPDFVFQIHTITRDNVVMGLKNYAEKHKANLLAFVSQHRNFWQNLVHHSITQNIALSTHKPMLVMHVDDV